MYLTISSILIIVKLLQIQFQLLECPLIFLCHLFPDFDIWICIHVCIYTWSRKTYQSVTNIHITGFWVTLFAHCFLQVKKETGLGLFAGAFIKNGSGVCVCYMYGHNYTQVCTYTYTIQKKLVYTQTYMKTFV